MNKDYGEQKESHAGNTVSVKNYFCPCLITSSDATGKRGTIFFRYIIHIG